MMKILMFFVALQKFCLSDPSVPKDPRITTSCHFLTGFSKFLPSFGRFAKKRLGPKIDPFCKVFGLVTAFLVFGGSKKVEIGLNRKNDMSPIKNFLAPLFF